MKPVFAVSVTEKSPPTLPVFFFFQAEDGIRDLIVTGVQTCALPISGEARRQLPPESASTPPSRRRRSPTPRHEKSVPVGSGEGRRPSCPRISPTLFALQIGRASCRERV